MGVSGSPRDLGCIYWFRLSLQLVGVTGNWDPGLTGVIDDVSSAGV